MRKVSNSVQLVELQEKMLKTLLLTPEWPAVLDVTLMQSGIIPTDPTKFPKN